MRAFCLVYQTRSFDFNFRTFWYEKLVCTTGHNQARQGTTRHDREHLRVRVGTWHDLIKSRHDRARARPGTRYDQISLARHDQARGTTKVVFGTARPGTRHDLVLLARERPVVLQIPATITNVALYESTLSPTTYILIERFLSFYREFTTPLIYIL